jgi:hypothetical protein
MEPRVLDLLAGDPLLVDQNQSEVREEEHVTHELVRMLYLLTWSEKLGIFCIRLRGVRLRSVT